GPFRSRLWRQPGALHGPPRGAGDDAGAPRLRRGDAPGGDPPAVRGRSLVVSGTHLVAAPRDVRRVDRRDRRGAKSRSGGAVSAARRSGIGAVIPTSPATWAAGDSPDPGAAIGHSP